MKTFLKTAIFSILFLTIYNQTTQAVIIIPFFDITINQNSVGGDSNFNFHILETYTDTLSSRPIEDFNIQTVNGNGSHITNTESSITSVFHITQDSVLGWNNPTIVCNSDNSLITTQPIDNGILIYAKPYSSIVCDFSNSKNNGNSSIMFLPGIEGSRLYKSENNGNNEKLWEPDGDYNKIKNLLMNKDGVSIENNIYAKDIIDNAYTDKSKGDVYRSFLSQLDSMKNSEHTIKDYSAIPYDWRISIADILNNGNKDSLGHIYYSGPLAQTSKPYIIQELRRLAKDSNTGKVTIIAHSTGGLITKALIDKLGPEASQQLIDKIIFVAVPQVGTPSAIGALEHGFGQALPTNFYSFLGISSSTIRELGKNMPEPYNLLPSSNYFTYVDEPVITFDNSVLLKPWREKYGPVIHSGESVHNFLTDKSRTSIFTSDDINYPIILNETLLNKAEIFHNISDKWIPSSGIQISEIAGWGNDTLKTLSYYQGFGLYCSISFPNFGCTPVIELKYKPKTVVDGDGTVLTPSALWTPASENVIRYWLNLKSYNSSYATDGNNNKNHVVRRGHGTIFEVPQLLTLLRNIITNNTNTLPEFISTSAPQNTDTATQLHFMLHSPLSFDLYDDQGNHTGFLPDGTLEEAIPDSTYKTFGEVKFISVPASSNLHLKMKGYDKGSFTLDIEKVQGDTTINTTTFAAVPTLPTTIATIDVSKDITISPLSVDEDGNGTADIILAPKVGEVVIPDFTPPEAKISIDPSSKDLKVEGLDDSGITTVTKDSNNYIITDKSGNKTKLVFQKTYAGKYLTYAKLTAIQYGDSPVINLPSSSFLYIWNPLTNPQTILSQTIAIDKTYIIEAVYDSKKNQTTVLLKKKGAQIQKQTFNGFHASKLNTSQGVIGYDL